MHSNLSRIRTHIQNFHFEDLFIDELGWDQYRNQLEIVVDGEYVTLTGCAEKRGLVVFTLNEIPEYKTRRNIEQQVAKAHRENMIIYTDRHQTQQVWQWVRREAGKPLSNRERQFTKGQRGENIAQILSTIAFSLEEEDELTIVDVTSRVKAAFDLEKVTKKFYERFKKQHDAFLKFIEGIPDEDFQRWYASVMLNRLMFIYFVQKKGFLNNDTDYLRNRLKRIEGNFYTDFLCPLFFEGFAKKDHTAEIRRLLGDVPYLNGGLFLQHQIEELYGEAIQIENAAFEKLFDFFDEYNWHLDERPLRDDNEINPDVLGYIFEKYINQKQMGAYYTKEDITEYISKNTIIPFLFDEARKAVNIAFEGDHTLWDLLVENPDRYIYSAVRHGVEYPLPENIAIGLNDVSQRGDWNTPAPAEYGLPTEIWREVVARRNRYEDIRAKMDKGEIRQINDLITLNLDIQQFAQDVIDFTDSPDVIRAFWQAINRITVLDPTCGSGAFLFAALNILEPIYEACLERMEAFVAESERVGQHYKDFRETLTRIDQHPNRRYFILKSIIIQNLYGVDIMEEAVEIAKLRLFLKLVAQVDDKHKIEPLPDIDFNIRAGNTLVGFATEAEFTGRLFAQAVIPRIETLKSTVEQFRREQLRDAISHEQMQTLKKNVRRVLAEITNVLDQNLMEDYGQSDLAAFRRSHQPFHWFVEFYGVLKNGGFDVIIGNPPYVEYKEVKTTYSVLGYKTIASNDLYAFVTERSIELLQHNALLGLIIPISAFGVDGFQSLQTFILDHSEVIWVSHYANRPSQIFQGAQKRLTILIGRPHKVFQNNTVIHSSDYLRWKKEERENLLSGRLAYTQLRQPYSVFYGSLEKLGNSLVAGIFTRLNSSNNKLELSLAHQKNNHRVYYTRKFGYFLDFFNFVPRIINRDTGKEQQPSELKVLYFRSDRAAIATIAALTSSTFFWYWNVLSDVRNLNKRDLLSFPLNPEKLDDELYIQLTELGKRYLRHIRSTSTWMKKGNLQIETFGYTSAKPIIDEIDRVLARHYGFTDEELDFIINYDIKYRMGDDLFEEEGD